MRWWIITLGILLLGCDRGTPTMSTTQAAVPPPAQALLSVVTPLMPNRPTHLAVDAVGNVYFSQQLGNNHDTVFVLGAGDVPKATVVTVKGILARLQAPTNADGTIESIAAGADGNLYFYFKGGAGRKSLSSLGRLNVDTGQIEILAAHDALLRATGFGNSLEIAQGTLVPAGNEMLFWIRHSDDGVVLRLSNSPAPAGVKRDPDIAYRIARSPEGAIKLTREEYNFAPGAASAVLFTDRWTGALWTLDPSGVATLLHSLVGLPRDISSPGVASTGLHAGMIAMFIADSEVIGPRVEQRVLPVNLEARYPAFVLVLNGELLAISRDDIHAAPGFPVYGLRINELRHERARDSFVGYDATSGQMLRITFQGK